MNFFLFLIVLLSKYSFVNNFICIGYVTSFINHLIRIKYKYNFLISVLKFLVQYKNMTIDVNCHT